MKAKKKKRVTPETVEMALCKLLSGYAVPEIKQRNVPFPHTFKVVRVDATGAPIILRIEDNTAEVYNPNYVAGELRKYVQFFDGRTEAFNVTYDKCCRIVRAWAHQTCDLTDLPKSVAFKDDPALAMSRLAFNPSVPADFDDFKTKAPYFTRILARLTNAEAFCLRIGSFYDAKADRKQAVWVSGPGDAGKSVLPWLIDELLPGATTTVSNKLLETSFWMAKLVGKRVAHVKEAAAKFIRTSEFKALTGDAVHSINQKNQPMFDARLDVLLFFYSNEAPEIPRDDALMKRVIDCRMAAIPAGEEVLSDDEIREKLRPELPWIVGWCVARYAELGGGRIPCSGKTLEESVTKYEADYLAFLEEHLIEDAAVDAEGRPAHILRSRFLEIMRLNGFVSSRDQSVCKRVFLANFKVDERKLDFETNEPGVTKRLYVYAGVRERSESERQFVKNAPARTIPACPGNLSRLQVVETTPVLSVPSLLRD